MIRRPPRSTQSRSSAASDVYKRQMLQRDNGLVNHVLVNNLHILGSSPFWLIGNNAFVSMAVVALWRSWPFAFLMIMAGMQSIPEEVYQAAAVDGAGVWQQLRHITLGMLRPVNVVLILMLFPVSYTH